MQAPTDGLLRDPADQKQGGAGSPETAGAADAADDGPEEEEPRETDGKGIKESKCKLDPEVASELLLASNCRIINAAVPQDIEPIYGRKRWKFVNLSENQRVDGSWAMTLRLVRKRKSSASSSAI